MERIDRHVWKTIPGGPDIFYSQKFFDSCNFRRGKPNKGQYKLDFVTKRISLKIQAWKAIWSQKKIRKFYKVCRRFLPSFEGKE